MEEHMNEELFSIPPFPLSICSRRYSVLISVLCYVVYMVLIKKTDDKLHTLKKYIAI